MVSWKKSLNQPAKLAVRVLAPGDGEAESGVTAIDFREPAKLATEGSGSILVMKKPLSFWTVDLSPTSWAGTMLDLIPQARLRHRLGLAFSPPASQARWRVPF